MHRRELLGLSVAGTASLASWPWWRAGPAARKQRILVLGGTTFLGPAVVARARERGHEVTLFNRGITNAHLFPDLEKLRGTRTSAAGDLSALAGAREWDAVVDVWPEEAALVEQTTKLLADRAAYYFFVSSIAVYRDFSRPGLEEDAPIHTDRGWYGGEKGAAEHAVQAAFPDRCGIARPHAIVGPRDPGTAFHYWLRRIAQHDEVLAPGSGEDPVQYSDVRDVAAWIVDCVEERRSGIHNVCGPEEPLTLRAFLEGCRDAISEDTVLTWAGADFLREDQGLHAFSDLPFWVPLDEDPGFFRISTARSCAAGATFRPLAESARDAWRWYSSYFFKDTVFPVGGTGISRERELEVLAAWRER
jgi:2'-hydroxyisoflavone reductase